MVSSVPDPLSDALGIDCRGRLDCKLQLVLREAGLEMHRESVPQTFPVDTVWETGVFSPCIIERG